MGGTPAGWCVTPDNTAIGDKEIFEEAVRPTAARCIVQWEDPGNMAGRCGFDPRWPCRLMVSPRARLDLRHPLDKDLDNRDRRSERTDDHFVCKKRRFMFVFA